MRLLVVEDDPKLCALLARGLAEEGYAVDTSGDGSEALWLATEQDYDAVILDIGLPGLSGMVVCRSLRERGRWAPVLMLTALDSTQHLVEGLDAGADDYLVKPFAFAELLARIRALQRRAAVPRPAALRLGDLVLDPASRAVTRADTTIDLTAKEFALLEYLMRYPGQALTRTQLVEHVWDSNYAGDLHVVNVYIAYLRAKIDRPFARHSLTTVRGRGYLMANDAPAD